MSVHDVTRAVVRATTRDQSVSILDWIAVTVGCTTAGAAVTFVITALLGG